MSPKGVYQTLSDNYMVYLVSKLTADQMMTATVKQQMTDACHELKAVFKSRIERSDWMSRESKINALEKLDNMVFCIGYPDKWVTEALPDLSQSQSLVEDVYTLRKARLNLFKALVGKDRTDANVMFNVSLSDNDSPLSMANAFYTPNFNAIFMMPFYCLPPYYDNTLNQAFNYASFVTPAHEMTHGFDTSGAKFDKNGDPKPIWANETDAKEFERRAEMLEQCFNGLEMLPDEMPGVMANGKATITENIADLGGSEIAFEAYNNYLAKNGFKGSQLKLQRQRFFRGIAEQYRSKYNTFYVEYLALGKNKENKIDPHSMNKERTNGILCNMDGWYDAFDIQPGDKLYQAPEKRVRIW
jgi:putative endopeptidase